MFRADSEQIDKIPQYPRRQAEDEDSWHAVYFLMYGCLGTLAQYGGIMISKRTITREMLVLYARIYGIFHMIIGIHHLIWSWNLSQYGKLELWRFDLPGVYFGTGASALILIDHAFCVAQVTVRSADLKDICHRKSVMDTATCATFISVVAFLIVNMAGIETSFQTERLLWAVTMYLVPVVLVLGFLPTSWL
jgi:hypothetical protein